MKISQLREEYYAASASVSEISRHLSFAGIAIIWIFKVGKDESGGIKFNQTMLMPLILFVTALALDLSQYLYKAIVWSALNTYHWRKQKDDDADVEISGKWNWPAIVLFYSKSVLCLISYFVLFRQIYGVLNKG